MNWKLSSCFLYSVAVILILTGLAKLYGAFGSASTLEQPHPLLLLTTRQVFLSVGLLELALSAYLLFGQDRWLKLSLTAWLGSNFLVYRIGLWLIDAQNACSCLGDLSHTLSISPRRINYMMLALTGYLLVGSCWQLLWIWRTDRAAPTIPSEVQQARTRESRN